MKTFTPLLHEIFQKMQFGIFTHIQWIKTWLKVFEKHAKKYSKNMPKRNTQIIILITS